MDEIDQILANIDEKDDTDYESIIRDRLKEEKPEPVIDDSDLLNTQNDLAMDEETAVVDDEPQGAVDEAPVPDAVESAPAAEQTPEPSAGTITAAPEIRTYTVRGTRSWNTREPYTMELDPALLEEERAQFRGMFFFLKTGLSDADLKKEIREHFLQYVRRPSRSIMANYEHFINTTIIGENEKTAAMFSLPGELKQLYTYHCGPVTMLKMILSLNKRFGIGYCYRAESSNRSKRFFPREYVKSLILNWYQENTSSLNLPFDSIQHLNEIKNVIAKKYGLEAKRFQQKLEIVNSKLPSEKKLTREKLIEMKGEELFGTTLIEVYRRFIDHTIFD